MSKKHFHNKAIFRFYEELNDFLPVERQKRPFPYLFFGSPAIKDVIEALGVPHVEVDLVLVNGESVDFSYQLKTGDTVSVYPVFESLDISEETQLRARPLRETRFVLDVHLGKTARTLRMLGFDTIYQNDFEDREIVDIAERETRIILTRDRELLKNGRVTHGYWVRSRHANTQIKEILRRFDLSAQIKPFHRCMSCNGLIESVEKAAIADRLEPNTAKYFDQFYSCSDCDKIYWKGSHYQRMQTRIEQLLKSIGKQGR